MKPLAQNTLIQNRYLIVQLVGKGGMGEVYLAVDQRLGSAIALKRTFFAGDETLGNAFEREARVLARLRHPVLPKVSDHFSEGEEQYLVMEHISGDDLMKRIEVNQKPFPLSWVMFWADQLLDALSYLHSHEPPIIHRDIKPQNLKLTDENHIVLLDFGLSKSSTGNTNLASGTGSTGSVVGYTPHYAPMEQIRGIGTSARSDIYSLSATLYQLMTNAVPADALSRADTLLNGMADPIRPPFELNSEVPQGVSEVLLKGMEVSQDKRFGSAREMQKALRKAFSEMQSAMSAKTEVFNAADLQSNGVAFPAEPNFDATEVMDPAALGAAVDPIAASGGYTHQPDGISPPTSQPADLNATIAFDPGSTSDAGGLRQSDVKTEVFIAGSHSFPQVDEPAPASSESAYAESGFNPTSDYSSFSGESETPASAHTGESFSPDATVPLISYEDNAAASEPSYGGYDQDSGGGDKEPEEPQDDGNSMAAAAAVSSPAASAAKPAKKKSSTGKIVMILGGLFIFLAALLGVGAAGVYYYSNYAAVEPTPEPTPETTPEPSPEPTVDDTLLTNTNTGDSNTNTDSNSNGNTNIFTSEPTPAPTERPDSPPRTDRTPATRVTPRPGPTRTPRTTPTRRPGGGAPDILQ